MYYCDICDKYYTRLCDYTRHLSNTKIDTESHHKLLVDYWNTEINKISADIKVLDVHKKNNVKHHYAVDIYNARCKHFSTILIISIKNGQLCGHKDCVSETKRRVALELCKDENYLKRVGEGVKKAFNDSGIRFRRLEKQAEEQRRRMSTVEAKFIQLLKENNVVYEHQKPMIMCGIGCIIDFYLPEYNLYININMDAFHNVNINKTKGHFKEAAIYMQNKDKTIRNVFKQNGYKFKEIYNYKQMNSLVNKLLEGGGVYA